MKEKKQILGLLAIVICTGLLQSCGGPLPQDWFSKKDSTSTDIDEKFSNACDEPVVTDSDKDGRSDECEDFLKTNKYSDDSDGDRIKDGLDCPTEDPECEKIGDKLKQEAGEKLADSSLLGSSALSESAPAGAKVTLFEQHIWIVDDNANSLNIPQKIKDLCQNAKTYVAVRFVGNIERVTEDKKSTIRTTSLDLCTKNLTKSTAKALSTNIADRQEVTFSDFKWAKGRTYGNATTKDSAEILFDPSVINSKKDFQTTLVVRVTKETSNSAEKIRTKWKSVWNVQNYLSHDGEQITIEPLEGVQKNWKRATVLDAQNILGFTGDFAYTPQ